MRSTLRRAGLFACLSVLFSLSAQVLAEGMVSQTREFHFTKISPPAPLSFDPFDTQGGTRTLSKVVLSIAGISHLLPLSSGNWPEDVETGLYCKVNEDLSFPKSPCNYEFLSELSLAFPFGLTALASVPSNYGEAPILQPGEGVALDVIEDLSGSVESTSPIALIFFSGPNPIPASLSGSGPLSVSSNLSSVWVGNPGWDGIITLTYHFND
ncbi:MAG: hypothetical protein KDD64_01725 [Bdellovibrionales bacterium]|nr:hypothetical protein [Bdellovibrionales bacterium]